MPKRLTVRTPTLRYTVWTVPSHIGKYTWLYQVVDTRTNLLVDAYHSERRATQLAQTLNRGV